VHNLCIVGSSCELRSDVARSGIVLASPSGMNQTGVASSTVNRQASAPGDVESVACVEAYYHEIAPFYEAELAGRDDLDFWKGIASERAGGRTLEIGAGTGRVTLSLAPSARQLVAIDLSPDLLRLARRSLSIHSHVSLVRADMRALPLLGPFDLVVAANDPLSHLLEDADRDRALRQVARCLAPDGRFLLDALWLSPSEAIAVKQVGGRVRHHLGSLRGEPLGITERWCASPNHRRCYRAAYEYCRPGCDVVATSFDARAWTPSEIHVGFRRAGLRVTQFWGTYCREPWDAISSPNLIVEATRASS
jgi:SAM-dependent methyltransferase